ncbi:MAG: thiamine pyrophosphate-dependent dehydrogenase E1 component subunit alpha [Aggregatilineales bacterium]
MDTVPATLRHASQLSDETLLEMFWMMLLSRRLDERAWILHRQGKIVFHISAIGHEAAQIAAAFAINRGVDYFYPYYRDLTASLAIGMTPRDIMLSLFGKAGDPASGGRQMPAHFSSKDLNIVSGSSSVATQVPDAAGSAFAIQYKQRLGMVDPNDETQPRLALTCLGEGSTSQGEWHEAMNWAGVHNLPFICLVQNNQYAISVPFEKQMATETVAERASAYGIPGVVVDGNDVLEMYNAMRDAVLRAYNGEGATLIEAVMYRPVPHSSDDDDRSYRPREEVEAWKKKDPVQRFQNTLMEDGVLTQALLDDYEQKAKQMVNEAQRFTEDAPYPDLDVLYGDVYAPLIDGEV